MERANYIHIFIKNLLALKITGCSVAQGKYIEVRRMFMSQVTIYHNPRCSKSRKALDILQAKNLDIKIVDYLKKPPTYSELSKIASALIGDLATMVRSKDTEFLSRPFNLDSKKDVCMNLSKKPKLIERPIVVYNNQAVIGRPPENIEELFEL